MRYFRIIIYSSAIAAFAALAFLALMACISGETEGDVTFLIAHALVTTCIAVPLAWIWISVSNNRSESEDDYCIVETINENGSNYRIARR